MAFSWLTSQVMGWMKAQSEPEGQQMTDCTEALLRDMQVASFGQQKEEGNPVPHCWRPAFPPQVDACRERRLDALVEVIAEAMR